ncbi:MULTISPECIES: hypothetical protein [Ignavibacterium]|jgi:hypothetical protein|uniref:hypothetical protein n=1 Tax=Ignavibacterium TaxID=795750 RepID=UPI0025BA3203|nr:MULTISPECIES: hypothetical protein [Ignavibacterium]MBI5662694.1 hypothetical protein [Ignavibacterium album]
MNKIILNIGLLIFCFSVIFFSQREMPLAEVIIKSFIVFISSTVILSVTAIVLVKLIQKTAINTNENSDHTILGSKAHE